MHLYKKLHKNQKNDDKFGIEGKQRPMPEKAVKTMLEESIRVIRETDAQMEEEKLSARARGQKLIAEAEKAAQATLAAAEKMLREERQAQLQQAEENAAASRREILAKAEESCRLLKERARAKQEAAVERILAEGV